MIVIRRIVTAWLLLGIWSVQAETGISLMTFQAGLLYIVQDDGLVTNLPAHATHEMLQHAQSIRSDLQSRQTQCAEDVESTRFKTHDTLITIVMPGGLLYAMNKQQRHAAAKQAYNQVSQQLLDLNEDLARLQVSANQQAFAMLK
jgi:predicted transcriptional regulator